MKTTIIAIASVLPLKSIEAGKDNAFTGSWASSDDRDVYLFPEGRAAAVYQEETR